MAKTVVGPLPFLKYLLTHDWDNLRYIKQIGECFECSEKEKKQYNKSGVTVKIIHGRIDDIVPMRMGKTVYNFATEMLLNGEHSDDMFYTSYTPVDADHNNIVSKANAEIMNQMMEGL